jgi:hypothetical protein
MNFNWRTTLVAVFLCAGDENIGPTGCRVPIQAPLFDLIDQRNFGGVHNVTVSVSVPAPQDGLNHLMVVLGFTFSLRTDHKKKKNKKRKGEGTESLECM